VAIGYRKSDIFLKSCLAGIQTRGHIAPLFGSTRHHQAVTVTPFGDRDRKKRDGATGALEQRDVWVTASTRSRYQNQPANPIARTCRHAPRVQTAVVKSEAAALPT
jgi:hypothetical protein